MTDPHPQPSSDPPSQDEQTPPRARTGPILTIAVIIFVLIGIGLFFVWKKNGGSNSIAQPSETADQIRSAFAPTSTPSGALPPPTPLYNASSSSLGYNPNTPTGNPNPTPTPPPANNQPAVAGITTYQNSALGFQVAIPGNWVAKQSGNVLYFYDPNISSPQAWVEFYDAGGTTLSDIQTTLQNSSSVTGVTSTTVDGQPALRYTSTSRNASGIAVIANNKIYYLHGAFQNAQVASNIHFTLGNQQNNSNY